MSYLLCYCSEGLSLRAHASRAMSWSSGSYVSLYGLGKIGSELFVPQRLLGVQASAFDDTVHGAEFLG